MSETFTGGQPYKIHAFYETLLTSVQYLETLGKLAEVSGYMRTLDKLEGIRSDLVRTDDSCQEWKSPPLPPLIEALRKWTEQNPFKQDKRVDKQNQGVDKQNQGVDKQNQGVEKQNQRSPNRSRKFQTRQQEQKQRFCIYCNDSSHRSTDCKKVVTVADERKNNAVYLVGYQLIYDSCS